MAQASGFFGREHPVISDLLAEPEPAGSAKDS